MMLILFWPAPCFGVHRQGRQGGALGGGQGAEVQLRGLHSASIINIFFPRQHFYLCQRWQLAGGLSLIFCSGGSGHNQDPQPKSNHLIMRTKNFKQSDNEGDEGVFPDMVHGHLYHFINPQKTPLTTVWCGCDASLQFSPSNGKFSTLTTSPTLTKLSEKMFQLEISPLLQDQVLKSRNCCLHSWPCRSFHALGTQACARDIYDGDVGN